MSDETGNLIVSNYRIWLNGNRLKDGDSVGEGDALTLAFDWRINNNEGLYEYKTIIPAEGIAFVSEKYDGDVFFENVKIGTYEAVQDGSDFVFRIHLDSEAVKNKSNIGGGAILDGIVSVDSKLEKPDGDKVNIKFGNEILNLTYKNSGSVSFDKSGGKLNDDGTIPYEIKVEYKDIIQKPTVTDTIDKNTQLKEDSFTITYVNADGDKVDVTKDSRIQLTYTYSDTDPKYITGYSVVLPDGINKSDDQIYYLNYDVTVHDDADFSSFTDNYVSLVNNADFTYKDDQGEEQTFDGKVTTNVNKPTIRKDGTYLEDSNGDPALYQRTSNEKYYWTKWDITINLNDYQTLLQNNLTDVSAVTDELFSGWVQQDFGVYYSLLSTIYGYYYNNRSMGSLPSDFAELRIYDSTNFLNSSDAELWLTNGWKLFSKQIVDKAGVPAAIYYDKDVTLDDFVYDKKSGNYTLTYLFPMPSETKNNRWKITASNTVTTTVYETPLTATDTIEAYYLPEGLLVKGPDDYDSGPEYVPNDYSGAGNLKYTKEIGADEEYTTIDWIVGVSPKRLIGNDSSETNKIINSIDGLTIKDNINGNFTLQQTGRYTNGQSAGTLGTINLEDIRVAVVSVGPSYDAEVDETYYDGWMDTLRNFYTARDNLKNAAKQAAEIYANTGFGTPEWNEALAAWQTANSAYNSASSSVGFKGELTYADYISLYGEDYIKVTSSSGSNKTSVEVKIPSNLSLKSYLYSNPTTGTETTGSGSSLSLASIIGSGYQIVVYTPTEIRSGVSITTSGTSFKNDASLDITPKPNAVYSDFPTFVVNAQYNIKREASETTPGTVTTTKGNGNLTIGTNTYNYSDGRSSIGWYIYNNMKKANAGNTLTLIDTIPEGLSYKPDSLRVFLSAGTGTTALSKVDLSSNALSPEDYSVNVDGNTVTFSIEYTDTLKARAESEGQYIYFYYKTDVDGDVFFSKQNSESFTNAVAPVWGEESLGRSTSKASISIPEFVSKEATDARGNISGEPVVDPVTNKIYGYYQIELNPEAAVFVTDGSGKYDVIDQMTGAMELDEDSIRVARIDGEDETELDQTLWSYDTDAANQQVTFHVPDGYHLKITYRVLLNVDPIADPGWMKAENTENTVSLQATGYTDTLGTSTDFSDYQAEIRVWAYAMNGELEITKFFINDSGEEQSLGGAEFTVYSVYDNNDKTYTERDKDYVMAEVTTDADGKAGVDNLPLDRLYRIVETKSPSGYVPDETNERYFILEGHFGISIPEELDIPDESISRYQDSADMKIENKKALTITGSKTWSGDAVYADELRPENITLHLYRYTDEKENAKEVTDFDIDWTKDGNSWTYTISNQPKYDSEYHTYTYYVSEDKVNGYETTYSDDTFAITNTLQTTAVSGTKTWKGDAKYKETYRPDSIELTLQADGKTVDAAKYDVEWTNTDSDIWKYSINGLPKINAEGKDIVYTVVEKTVNGYKTTYADDTFDITNTFETVNVSGKKEWDDADNQDGKRPSQITINLLSNGTEISSQTVTGDDWTFEFAGLPKMSADGKTITYSISETLDKDSDYSLSGVKEESENVFTVKNTYDTDTTSVQVVKKWDDDNNADGSRPASVTVHLFADGKDTGKKAVLNEDNKWTSVFSELDVYASGKEISYTVQEDSAAGYEVTYSALTDGVITVTNTHEVDYTSVTVEKHWSDNNDQDGVRPKSVTVYLTIDGVKQEGAPVTLSEDNNWTYTWSELVASYKGSALSYGVEEALSGTDYVSEITGSEKDGYVITNTHATETIDVSAEKNWIDGDDRDGIRPDMLQVELYADGKATGKKAELTESNGWSYQWTGLPRKEKGQDIEYTVEELSVPDGYEGSLAEGKESVKGSSGTVVLINTHNSETISVSGAKTWNDSNDQDGKRPESIIVNLIADGNKVDSKVVTAEDNWKYTFTDLYKFSNGKEIQYSVDEEIVPNYALSTEGYDLINTYAPGKTSVKVIKQWDDQSDKYGMRPTEIQVQLKANGVNEGEPVTLNAANGWIYTWNGLDQKRNKSEVDYTVEEIGDIEGYQKENAVINGNAEDGYVAVLQNTLLTGKISVTKQTVDVEGNDLSDVAKDTAYHFTITRKGEKDPVATLSVKAGEKQATDHLPIGTYRITEVTESVSDSGIDLADYDFVEVQLDKSEVEITSSEDQVIAVTATNIYKQTEKEVTTIDISGKKTWDDADFVGTDGYSRPESIEVTLSGTIMNEGKQQTVVTQTIKVTPDADGSWNYSWKAVPEYQDGQKIVYTVSETVPEGYKAVVDGYDITNTIADEDQAEKYEPVSLTVKKTDSKTGTTLNGAVFTLTDADGKEMAYATGEDGTVTITFEADGDYTLKETTAPAGYDINAEANYMIHVDSKKVRVEYDKETSLWTKVYSLFFHPEFKDNTLTVADESSQISIPVTKDWQDADDQDGLRPESITVELLADGKETGKTLELSEANKWSGTFDGLDEMKSGESIVYTIKEIAVKGYEVKITGDAKTGFVITNRHEASTIDITGKKTWDDADFVGTDGYSRPESIEVTLSGTIMNEGKQQTVVTQTIKVTPDADGSWNYSWKAVPEYQDGQKIVYTVSETVPEGYKAVVDGYDITNTIADGDQAEKNMPISLTVQKIDSRSEDVLEGAEFTLTDSDGNATPYTTGSDGTVTIVFESEGDYTLEETTAPVGYTVNEDAKYAIHVDKDKVRVEYDRDTALWTKIYSLFFRPEFEENTLTVTDDIITTDVTVAKVWDDENDAKQHRPDTIVYQLFKTVDDETTAVEDRTVELSAENAADTDVNRWEASFEALPAYEDGKEITYSIRELDADGNVIEEGAFYNDSYLVTYDDDSLVATNSYIETELELTKIMPDYYDGGQYVNATLVFEITGYSKSNPTEVIYTNTVGLAFDAESAISQTRTITDLPSDIGRIEVKEVYSGNYQPDSEALNADFAEVEVDGRIVHQWSVTFNNSLNTHEKGSGIVNRYAVGEDGVKFQGTHKAGLNE